MCHAPNGTSKDPRPPRVPTLARMSVIFLLALSLRAYWIAHMEDLDPKGVTTAISTGDCYHCIAKRILENGLGEGFGPPTKPLGYPLFLAAVYRLFGENILLVRCLQAFLDSLSCLILMSLGSLLFSRPVGTLAGLMGAGYPFFIRDAARYGTEPVFMFFFLLAVLFVIKASGSLSIRHILLGGLFLGISTLIKPAPIVLVPAIVLFLGTCLWPHKKQLAVLMLAFCILPPLLSIPWGLRNLRLGYGFVTTETRGGLTFWLGNSEMTVHRFIEKRTPKDWNKDLDQYPSSYFYEKAFQFIRENPITWLKLMGYKIAEFWRMVPEKHRDLPSILTHAVIPPLGLIGLFVTLIRRRKESFFFFLLMVTFTLFFAAYNTELRYRLPLVDPFLAVYASFLIVSIMHRTSSVFRKSGKLALVLLAGLYFCLDAGTTARAVNLVPNPGFEKSDNPSFPNGWTNYAAANFYPYDRIQLDEGSVFEGKKSLRIHVIPITGLKYPFTPPYVNCYSIRTVPDRIKIPCGAGPPEVYTFSAYMKTDTAGIRVHMGTGRSCASAHQIVTLGTSWQRYSLTFKPCETSESNPCGTDLYFTADTNDRPYTFWVDAVQLEPGETATSFQEAPSEPGTAQGSAGVPSSSRLKIEGGRKVLECPRTQKPPVIDGDLGDPSWKEAAKASHFVHYLTGLPEKEETQALVMRDDQNLYVGFRCSQHDRREPKAEVRRRDGFVWEDDAVEIFLDTNLDRESHLQFILSAAGTQADLKRSVDPLSQALGQGPSSSLEWNAFWEAKTRRKPEEWTAEIRIPFSSLGLDKHSPARWGFNACRDNPAIDDYTCWSFTSGKFPLATARFGLIEHMEVDPSTLTPFEIHDVRCKWDDLTRQTFCVTWRMSIPRKDNGGPYRVKLLCKDTKTEKVLLASPSQRERAEPFSFSGLSTLANWPEKGAEVSLEILVQDPGSGNILEQWQPTVFLPPLLGAYLERNYYTDEDAARLHVQLPLPDMGATKGWKLHVSLAPVSSPISIRAEPGESIIRVPLGDIPQGVWPLHLSVMNKGGIPLIQRTLSLDKKAPSPGEVKIDREKLCLLVGGEPFLPYSFGIGSPVPWPDVIRESRQMGFNTLITRFELFREHNSLQEIRQALDDLHGMGMKVVFWIYPDKTNREYETLNSNDRSFLNGLAQALEKEIRLYVPTFRDHPAILAWKFADEWWDRTLTAKLYRLCKELDPYRPAFHNQTGGLDTWRSGSVDIFKEEDLFTDILSWDVYPFGYRGGIHRLGPVVEDSVKKVMIPLAQEHRLPMMFWLQMINLYDRVPTRGEYLLEVYALALYGVRGFFTFFHKPETIELWQAAGEVGRHWEELKDVWLSCVPDGTQVTQDNGLLLSRGLGGDGSIYILCVNLESTPRPLSLGIQESKAKDVPAYEILTGSKRKLEGNNMLRDVIPARGVKIYKIR